MTIKVYCGTCMKDNSFHIEQDYISNGQMIKCPKCETEYLITLTFDKKLIEVELAYHDSDNYRKYEIDADDFSKKEQTLFTNFFIGTR